MRDCVYFRQNIGKIKKIFHLSAKDNVYRTAPKVIFFTKKVYFYRQTARLQHCNEILRSLTFMPTENEMSLTHHVTRKDTDTHRNDKIFLFYFEILFIT